MTDRTSQLRKSRGVRDDTPSSLARKGGRVKVEDFHDDDDDDSAPAFFTFARLEASRVAEDIKAFLPEEKRRRHCFTCER